MECYRCGDCCTYNHFGLDDLLQAVIENPKFADYLSHKFPLLEEEISVVRKMSKEELTDSRDVFDLALSYQAEKMSSEDFYTRLRSEAIQSGSESFDPEGLMVPPENQGHVLYRLQLKLSNLGRNPTYNKNGEHCVFLEKDNDLASCLIHPEHLTEQGMKFETDIRSAQCAKPVEDVCLKLERNGG